LSYFAATAPINKIKDYKDNSPSVNAKKHADQKTEKVFEVARPWIKVDWE
jgi:hypothetical protein